MGRLSTGTLHVVGIGGSTRSTSSTERVLVDVLARLEARGATTTLLAGSDVELPTYAPERPGRTPQAQRLLAELERSDAIVISSPGYHGGVSGMIKNALDYAEDLRDAERPYFEDRPVGLIVCADGWQATTSTLISLRSTVHALRGWPTPLGIALHSSQLAAEGGLDNPELGSRMEAMVDQLVRFAGAFACGEDPGDGGAAMS